MANYGFHHMLSPDACDPWRFKTRDKAYEAARCIDCVSTLIGLEAEEDELMRKLRMDGSADRQARIALAFRTTS